jgi:hypothetical protein
LKTKLHLDIQPQPDDSTCGPTCLQALYRYYGDEQPLDRVIAECTGLEGGGTLAVLLAEHALRRGFAATIYTYNLALFDPTWFELAPEQLAARLREQQAVKSDARLAVATRGYLAFLELGGRLLFRDLTAGLIRRHLKRGVPILTGLSATYLYHCARERPADSEYDDVRGVPVGHFVVLAGYEPKTRLALVVDPLHDNPAFATHEYQVPLERLVGAILLGVLTHDANLLIIEPRQRPGRDAR